MALSIGRGFSSVKPMAFQLNNQSTVSDVYADELESTAAATASNPITPVNPVQYATASAAKSEAVDPTKQLAENLEVSKSYNNIAESFGGSLTGYGSRAVGSMYSTVGNNFDMYI